MGLFSSIGKVFKGIGKGISKVAGPIVSGLFDIGGGLLGDRAAKKQLESQEDLQREFAQYGIRWKVADAMAAGLHPLAALGADTLSYTPQSVFGSDLARGIGRMGQGIGRAVSTQMTRDEKDVIGEKVKQAKLQTEWMGLRNAALWKDFLRIDESTPSMPRGSASDLESKLGIVGQGDDSVRAPRGVQFMDDRVIKSRAPGVTAGVHPLEKMQIRKHPGVGWNVWFTPTQEVQEAISEIYGLQAKYYYGTVKDMWNGLKAMWKGGDREFKRRWLETWKQYLPRIKGRYWEYSPITGWWSKSKEHRFIDQMMKKKSSYKERRKRERSPAWNELTF